MQRSKLGTDLAALVLFVCGVSAALSGASVSYAQNTQVTVTTARQSGAGVVVDPQGVLRTVVAVDETGRQTRERIDAAKVAQNQELQRKSKLRKVSLQRLEAAIVKQLDADRPPTDEMRYLAGLQRIQQVFCYPESGDIVIAGPAEGFYTDLGGHVVGLTTGRAVVDLEDLLTALRAYRAGGGGGPRQVGCSIDATQEGLAKMNQFLASLPKTADASMATEQYAEYIVNGLRTNLGLQKVRIDGVSPRSHFAQVMVEADYRMKLIGIGLEQPGIKGLKSYVELAGSGSAIAPNSMQRWWFVPDYKCVRVSPDELAMELVGNAVQLQGEDELVTADGRRQRAENRNGGNRASQAFTRGFTQRYPELAAQTYCYAQLRNLIDLTVVAAFLQKYDYYGRTNWAMPVLGDESKVKTEYYNQPVHVETAATHYWKGGRLATPVGGGVTLHPEQALLEENLLKDEGQLGKARSQISPQGLAAGQWWWD